MDLIDAPQTISAGPKKVYAEAIAIDRFDHDDTGYSRRILCTDGVELVLGDRSGHDYAR
jgi:hypothetical protein